MPELEVLYEDNHLLVINKPAKLATMGAASEPTVHQLACEYIAEKHRKPGKVFLGIVHRLDSMSSGVLVLARTSKAASRLSEQFRQTKNGPTKIYLAAVEGDVAVPHARWQDWIAKNDRAHRMEVVPQHQGAVGAVLDYQVLRAGGNAGLTLLAVRLITGRKHQIRLQCSSRGHCVYGDVKYGAAQRRSLSGIALHAWSLSIAHPTKAEPMTFRANPPRSWGKLQPSVTELEALRRMIWE